MTRLLQTPSANLREPVRVRIEAVGREPEALAVVGCWGVLVRGVVPPPDHAKWPARPQLLTQALATPGSLWAAAVCRGAVLVDSRQSRPVCLDVSASC